MKNKFFNSNSYNQDRPVKMKYAMNCYNCGIPLTKKTNNGEHVPPKNLFEGRGPEYKINRKKIPACYDCNNKYSLTDEEFRNLIGVINKHPDLSALTENAVKSMNMGAAKKSRMLYDESGNVKGVAFDLNEIKKFHIKNFKGVFFIQYGYPIPDSYRILVDIKENEVTDGHLRIINYAKDNFTWKYSGHPDIFSYIIQPFRPRAKLDSKDIIPESSEKYFVCLLRYNKSHTALVLADTKNLKI
ncbi:MAG TPA: hypothetical protein VN026_03905 [Bacteroidia bacterium]|nr:hypothetical protein [Bacteroidia bacterium]